MKIGLQSKQCVARNNITDSAVFFSYRTETDLSACNASPPIYDWYNKIG